MTAQPVVLTEDHRDFVDHLVAKGDFPSAEAVVAHAIELLLDDEAEWQVFLDRINVGHERALDARLVEDVDVPIMAVRNVYRRARNNLLARRAMDAAEDPG